MTERWISSVLLLLLGLVSQPRAAGAADTAAKAAPPAPVVVSLENPVVTSVDNPTVSLLWAVIGSEDGVAVADGFVLTRNTGPGLATYVLPAFYALADPANALALTPGTAITEVTLGAITPNPNHGEASVAFALPRASQVHLAIFDLQGRQVEVLANGLLEAGPHTVAWQGVRDRSARVAGVYFVRLSTPERVINRRMVVTY